MNNAENHEFEALLADVSRFLKEIAVRIDGYPEHKLPLEARLEMLKEKFPEDLRGLVRFETSEN